MSQAVNLTVSAKTEFPDGSSTTVTVEHVIVNRQELLPLQEIYIHGPDAALKALAESKAKA